MDQNRCLLDVIDNPQLLQSFLESETSATETTNNPNQTRINNNDVPNNATEASNQQANNHLTSSNAHASTTPATTNAITDNLTQHATEVQATQSQFYHASHGTNQINHADCDSNVDPVVSVLDSIITETIAETSPSTQQTNTRDDNSPALQAVPFLPDPTASFDNNSYPLINHLSPFDSATLTPTTTSSFNFSSHDMQAPPSVVQTTPSSSGIGVSDQSIDTDNFTKINETNSNSTSSSDNGSSDLLVGEYFSQSNTGQGVHKQQQQKQEHPQLSDDSKTIPGFEKHHGMLNDPNVQQFANTSTNPPTDFTPTSIDTKPTISNEPSPSLDNRSQQQEQSKHPSELGSGSINIQVQNQQHQVQAPQPQSSQTQPLMLPSSSIKVVNVSHQSEMKSEVTLSFNPQTPASKLATNNAPKPPEATPKPKRNTSRSKKNKANLTTSSTTPTLPSTGASIQHQPLQTNQYIHTPPPQQQLIFQNNNIRQPNLIGSSPMQGQQITGMPQPQRVIQIQTPSGPMYFAIAPGPAANNNNNINNNNNTTSNIMHHHQQQSQQTRMQSQYPSQQICFQPNSNVVLNRPQVSSPVMQQQQQLKIQQTPQSHLNPQQQSMGIRQTMISSSGQTMVGGHQIIQTSQQQHRLGSTMVGGQTVAMNNSNQQNLPQQTQQQHIVIPSSQSMMMPRVPNQILVNRPLSGHGQLMPGQQQQFIPVMTNQGPMLIAIAPQQTQTVNNTMIDYNNQIQAGGQPVRHTMQQTQPQLQSQSQPHQQQQMLIQSKQSQDVTDSTSNASTKSTSAKNANNSKNSGLDLADLLLDCGILPEDKSSSQSTSSGMRPSQSPSLSQISSPMPTIPQTNSPMPNSSSPQTVYNNQSQSHPLPNYSTQPIQQPVRITFNPDGQMIMQPAIYGAVRPMLAGSIASSPHMSTMTSTNVMNPSSDMITMTSSANPSTPKTNSEIASNDSANKKTNAKGKTAAVKRSRSKKSDIDKFPQLKTPKIAQQQQQQQQQQLQTVAVMPMAVLSASSDQKPHMTQLASGQQVPLAKFVTPIVQSAATGHPTQTPTVASNIIQTNLQTVVQGQTRVVSSGQVLTTQSNINSGDSISSSLVVQNHHQQSQQQHTFVTTVSAANSTAPKLTSSSGNVQTNLLKIDRKIGTVESNPHISSSLTPNLSLTVDTQKIEQNGLKQHLGGQLQSHSVKGLVHNIGGVTTIVLKPATACIQTFQQQSQLEAQRAKETQQQQLARQKELRAKNILNQLGADQNAALNPLTKNPFVSVEDACKRLLRYHVFETEEISEDRIRKVDEIFDATVESLIMRKQRTYDKFRLFSLKQSMKFVSPSEQVMLEQLFVNDELSYLKKERELFREYEAHLESMALEQSKVDSKEDSSYYAFGGGSPKHKIREHDQDSATHSRDMDDWLMTDKWADSRFPSVPDSEAATAIESILNEELS